MKKIVIGLTIAAILFILLIYKIKDEGSSEVLFVSLQHSDFNTVQANMNTYAVLDKPLTTIQDMQEYFRQVDKKIVADYEYELKTENNTQRYTLSRAYITGNKKILLKLETLLSNRPSTYIIVDAISFSNHEKFDSIQQNLKQIYGELNLKPKINMTITANRNGNMDIPQKKSAIYNILKKIDASTRQDYITDEVYSVVGYTSKISEYICNGEQKININLALRYNSYEDKTYLYLATPMITVEY